MTSADTAGPGHQDKGKNRGKRARPFKIVIGIALAVALIWTGGWFAASRAIAGRIAGIEARAEAQGATLSCGNPSIGGFPFRFDVTCMPVSASCPAKQMFVDLAGIEALALAYNPSRALFAAKGPLTAKGPHGTTLDADWTSMQASLSLGLSGLKRYSMVADGLKARIGAPTGLTAELPVSADHAEFHLLRDEDAPGFLDMAVSVRRLSAVLPDRPTLPTIDGDLTAAIPETLTHQHEGDLAAAWIASGQPLRIEAMNATIDGVSIELSGEVTPAADGRLNGGLTLRFDQIDKLPDLINDLRPGSGARARQMITLVSALLRPVTIEGRTWREAQVTIASGQLRLGFIPLGTLPSIGARTEPGSPPTPAGEPFTDAAAPTGPVAAIAPGGEAAGKPLSAMGTPSALPAPSQEVKSASAAEALPEAVIKRCAATF